MRLNADGKKRLEAMKKALAAGLPLAGLLAGMPATEASAAHGGMLGAPIPQEWRPVAPPVRKPVEKPVEKPAPATRDTTGREASHRVTFPGDIPCPDEATPLPSAVP